MERFATMEENVEKGIENVCQYQCEIGKVI